MDYVLRTNALSKKYGKFYAVDKVNVTIAQGDIYGLIGENGAGKSTFMKMVAGLINPSEGSMELFGDCALKEQRCRLGCAIEEPALYSELTAGQNLEIYRRAYGITDHACVTEILEQMDLQEYQNKQVKKFSMGMKQRLAIGLTLLGNPDFLILDEPINGLDPTGIQEIRNFLLKLNKERHITILISSHILGELSKLANKYGIIKKGKLLDEVTANQLRSRCQCCLQITVSDAAKAAVVLEKQLHTTNYEVMNGQRLRVFDYVEDAGIVNTTLANAGIMIYESVISRESLEDYFNKKMRGNGND